jgi:hypothetical protein
LVKEKKGKTVPSEQIKSSGKVTLDCPYCGCVQQVEYTYQKWPPLVGPFVQACEECRKPFGYVVEVSFIVKEYELPEAFRPQEEN